jgi:hypothetical protein
MSLLVLEVEIPVVEKDPLVLSSSPRPWKFASFEVAAV